MNEKINLLNLAENELQDFVMTLGMKKFQGKQLFTWLNQKLVRNINDITNLSLKNRETLIENGYIPFLNLLRHQVSKIDRTEKFLFELEDKNTIETVLLRHKEKRNTLCISSQVGCAVKCSFCATGQEGIVRNLEVNEIINQVYTVERRLAKTGEHINNIVFMGMGEPLLNFDNVIKSVNILTSKAGLDFSKRKITISTCGIVPSIEKILLDEIPLELAISLHSAINEKRDIIMPINRRYPLEDLQTVLEEYQRQTKRRISFEYILIDKFNASQKDADALADFVHNFDHMVNIIPCNEVDGSDFKRPNDKKIEKFIDYLTNVRRVNAVVRREKGADIDGACGQLRQNSLKNRS